MRSYTPWFPRKPSPIPDQNGKSVYPFSDQNGSKTLPNGAAHTYIAYIRKYLRVFSRRDVGLWQTPSHGPAVTPPRARQKSLVPRVCRESGAKKIKETKLRNKTNKRTTKETKIKNHRQDMNPWLPQNLKGALCNELYHSCLLRAWPFTWSICDCCVGFNDVIVDYSIADIW